MTKYKLEFEKLLLSKNRYDCIKYAKGLLDKKKVSVVELYEGIVGPCLSSVGDKVSDSELRIWQEHIYASIVRSVVENCYLNVIEESKLSKIDEAKKVMVICPSDEYHEIGPRMVADFFTILGYDTTYIGANTPKEEFVLAIKKIEPDIVAISVSNYYNLVSAKDAVDLIKTITNKNFKIIVGGEAFEYNKKAYKQIGADYQAKTFDDIKRIGSEISC